MNKKSITTIQIIGVLVALLGIVVITSEQKNTFPEIIRDKGLIISCIGGLVSAIAPTFKVKKNK